MALPIPQNKQNVQARKSLINELQTLTENGEIDKNSFDFFMEKLNEAGELTLAMNHVHKRDKDVKEKLKKTAEYQEKIKVAQMKKYVKAKQEKNLDETNGALELIANQLGSGKGQKLKNLLTE